VPSNSVVVGVQRTVSKSAANVNVDVSQLRQLAKDLRKADPDLGVKLRLRMRGVGGIVADTAQEMASYSTRIPGSIKVRVSGFTVKVVAGGPGAGDAAPIENRGKGFVRHPVFGNRNVWTAKNSHPAFLAPALDADEAAVVEELVKAVDDTMRDIGMG
jgi:hypothetical protein